jgi:hypothetical protein
MYEKLTFDFLIKKQLIKIHIKYHDRRSKKSEILRNP